jgi:hypothetical protein
MLPRGANQHPQFCGPSEKQALPEIAAGGQVSERLLQQAKKIKKEDPEAHEKKISLQ